MISVGVAVIGLLGVLALLPVASQLAQQGLNEDRKTAAGVAALDEFKVRDMANGEAWVRWGNNLATPSFMDLKWWPEDANDSVWGTNNGGPSNNGDDDNDGIIDEFDEAGWPASDTSLAYVPAQPVCIDPRLVTRIRANSPTLDHGFPLSLSQSLQIPRVSILATAFLPDGTALTAAQGVLVADQVFQLDDDLVFNTPKDTTLAPLQRYAYGVGPDGEWGVAGVDDNNNGVTAMDPSEAGWPGSDDVPIKRQSHGDMSWMAMVAPVKGTHYGDTPLLMVYIIVFYKRDLEILTIQHPVNSNLQIPDPTVPHIERVSGVSEFHSFGVGGGDVKLRTAVPAGTNFVRTDRKIVAPLDIQAGDWLMLMQQVPIPNPSPSLLSSETVFRWYRVSSVDDEVFEFSSPPPPATPTEEVATRDVTLVGPDWDPSYATTAVFVPGVVGVYETTTRLESSLIWSN